MSSQSPFGGGQNPFEGIFGDLARVLGSQSSGPLNWQVARQVGTLIADGGESPINPEPVDRIRLENLVHLAELHVGEVSGFDTHIGEVRVVTRGVWASNAFDAWAPLLEALATSLSQSADKGEDASLAADPGNPLAALGNMEQFLGPMLLGMQIGGMVGQLAQRTLGRYDFPIPRSSNDVEFIAANLTSFANDWSISLDELSLYAAVEEVTRTVILTRPHVRERFNTLLLEYVSGFRPDATALQERMSQMDLSNPNDLPAMIGDPQALLGAMQSDEQRVTLAHLSALIAALSGYVDYVVAAVAQKVIPSAGSIGEAVKRRRVEESDGQRLAEQLLGLELSQATFDRGEAFISGVVERAGEAGLRRLWHSAHELPSPAEVDAPGLWLARIDLPSAD